MRSEKVKNMNWTPVRIKETAALLSDAT